MDGNDWLGIGAIAGAAVLLLLSATSEAAAVLAGRSRTRLVNSRLSSRPESVHLYVHERERLLAGLFLARIVSIAGGTLAAASIVFRRTGVALGPALLVLVAVAAAAGLLEALPRVVVSHDPERWIGVVGPVNTAIRLAFFGPAWLLDLPARSLLRLPAFKPDAQDEPEEQELLRLVELEESQGGIEQEEREMIRAVIELEDTLAREIMVPRLDITALDAAATVHDAVQTIAEQGYSRIPVFESSLDNVVGVVLAKDVLASLAAGRDQDPLSAIARPPLFVPETKPVDALLRDLRRQQVHLAVVLDEYGGTAGIITMEDLVEQIVGEIEDEYDEPEPSVEVVDEGEMIVDGREHVDVLRDFFGVEIEAEDFDTVGGLVAQRLGRLPVPNDTVETDGLRLTVLTLSGRRVRRVRVSKMLQPVEQPEE